MFHVKKDPKDLVRDGYNRVAAQYEDFRGPFREDGVLAEFMGQITPGGQILDAGCGTGIIAKILVDHGYQLTGIDISQSMIDLAQKRVPEATFDVGDMAALDFDEDSFDGILSTYAVFHIPRTDHLPLFAGFRRTLKKGGTLLFSSGVHPEGSDGVWTWDELEAVPMYWSYHGPEKTLSLLKTAGFEIISTQVVETQTETETERHYWILARAI
jgi:ubiquinone/menaquinone biosynthesis C-methylase UbiE